MSVTIFTMTHKAFPAPKDPIYVPLQVGRAGAADLGYLRDDTGVNISEKNCYYGELTGVYWVWKNIRTEGCVGVCHYRRYFCTEEGRILNERDYEEILSSYDLITSKLLRLNFSYYEGYASDYNIHDLLTVGEVIRAHHPAFYETFARLAQGRETYFGNMCACRKPLFDEYCAWLFDIFEKAESQIDASSYDSYHRRVYGFLSEFLLYVWVTARGLSAYGCKVGMTEEKRETAEVKEQLAARFAKKDIAGAKAYLLGCLEKRPDILMEASDITGELRLSMQVIAVCELEQAAYGKSVIDRKQGFDALMAHFRRLNGLVLAALRENGWRGEPGPLETVLAKSGYFGSREGETAMSPLAVEFLKTEQISDIALEASVRLFCTEEEARALMRSYFAK